MDHQDLTPVAQDYLKVVWSATEWSDEPATTKLLADRMGVGPSTVSETVRRLATQGLLEHAPYGAIALTDTGRRLALAMVRRHRLIETFLVHVLGYGWDEVHDEAEVLEHAVSDTLVERIDAQLGHPVRDPHGDPIPTATGDLIRPAAVPLATAAPGTRGTVARISDADPDVLRYLDELGIGLDAAVEVVDVREYAGTMAVRLDAGRGAPPVRTEPSATVQLGLPAARHIWITVE